MTEKLTMPAKAPRKRGGGRRLLFHFILFTLLGALLLGFGIHGQVLLHRIAEDKILETRSSALIEAVTNRVKTEAEVFASTTKQRQRISGGLSSKTRSVRTEATAMLTAGTDEKEVAAYIYTVLSEAAISRLTDDDEATVTLSQNVTNGLAEKRDDIISACIAQVEAQISAMGMRDVRTSLTRDSENYGVMYYSPLMLWVGGAFLAIGLFCGAIHFFAGEDLRRKVTDIVEPMDYLAPFFFGVIIFTLYPMVRVFIMAFQERYKLTGEFVGWGIGNFRDVLFGVNTKLPQALLNTFIYVLLTVPISTVIAILLANLLNQKIKLRALFQTAYFLPMVTSAVAVGMVWKYMFNGDYGLINYLLSLFGADRIPWLTQAQYSMAVMVIYGIWDSLPFTIILLISGLQNIDDHYYTVAKVDGAKSRRIFLRITVPLLAPTIGLVLIINSISAFKVFNSVVVLFSGTPGPMYNMYTMVYYIFEQISTSMEYGRAAAASLVLFVVILLFTVLQRFIQRKWNYN
ncbi:MAG: sugar ABC transporter permease [Clostridia bacterium]|nr:sugar ABC transporter permease [Clostridia bacterium]